MVLNISDGLRLICGAGGGGTHKRKGEERTVVMEGKKKTVKEGSPSIKYCKNAVLTPAQFFEFQRQGLIFEHMKAGLPVPRHVWIPIWKDVASSFGSDRGGIYKLYPSCKYFFCSDFFSAKMVPYFL